MFHSGCLISVSLFHSLQQAKGPLYHGPGWPMAAPFPLFTTYDLSEKKHTFQPGIPVTGMVLGVHKTERGERDRRERRERERRKRGGKTDITSTQNHKSLNATPCFFLLCLLLSLPLPPSFLSFFFLSSPSLPLSFPSHLSLHTCASVSRLAAL